MMRPAALFLLTVLAMSAPATAQDEMPAVGGDAAVPLKAPPVEAAETAPAEGTKIISERESPIGLYITPWRNALPQTDADRPARLLQEQLRPVDRLVFQRQLDYYDALSGALKSKGLVTPASR